MAQFLDIPGQGLLQIAELFLAFVLSALIGAEREIRQKSAGLRTHTLVGVSAALFMLISKYGFNNILSYGRVVLDPSRVAAQVVSGIGFIGGGVIFMRRDVVRLDDGGVDLVHGSSGHGLRRRVDPVGSRYHAGSLHYYAGLPAAGAAAAQVQETADRNSGLLSGWTRPPADDPNQMHGPALLHRPGRAGAEPGGRHCGGDRF